VRINLKTIKLVTLFTIIAVISVSIGAVSALSASDATITANLSNSSPAVGQLISVSVTFQSHTSQQLRVFAVGLHGDWMVADRLYGPTLSNDPPVVNGNGNYVTQFTVPVTSDVPLGSHRYYVGVDGVDSSGNSFSLNSAEATLQVIPSGSTAITPTPTATTTPSQSGGAPLGSEDLLFYVAVVAIVAMVVLAIMVLFTLRRRNRARPAAQPVSNPPTAQPEPEQTPPPQEKSGSGEEFDI
jgi:hypothetical protein